METLKRIIILSLGLAVAFMASVPLCEAATTISVPSLGNSTIQSAIDNASLGDTVLVSNGTYTENIDFKGKEITVKSKYGAAATTINGNASGSVVTFDSITSATLSGFTIKNGKTANGAGISCSNSSPTITGCIINDNISSYGGGIYCASFSSPTIINCTISSNKADNEGGGIWGTSNSSIAIVNSIVWDNSAITSSEIRGDNVTASYSDIKQDSGIYTGAGNINDNPLFSGNGDYHLQAASPCIDAGTAIYSNLPDTDMDGLLRPLGTTYDMGADEQCLDADNDGYYFGGNGCTPVDCDDNVFSINPGATEICDGKDNNCDGSIDEGCDTDLDGLPDDWEYEFFGDLTHEPNEDPDNDGYTNLQESKRGCDPQIAAITRNVPGTYTSIQAAINASACGDTILVAPGTYTENIIFSGQVVTVAASGPDTIIDGGGADSVVRFESGENEYTVLSGFVIRNGGNTLYGYGGGIDIFESSPTIINNIITNNDADLGGGIACDVCSSVIMNNTITDNTALFSGAGIYCLDTNSPYVANTIIWNNNGAEIDLDNASITVAYSDVEGSYTGTGNINSDPLFLNETGADYHLLAGSPCIDSGIYTSIVLNDIDGNARPQGTGFDMGADEYVAPDTSPGGNDGVHREGANGSGCFIATAVYGSPMAHEVRILCRFRDTYLLPNPLGQKLVSLYYKYSPPVADYIRDNPYLKAVVRGVLKPVIWLTEKIVNK